MNPLNKTGGDDVIGKQCFKVMQERDSPCPFCTNNIIFGDSLGKPHVWEFQNEVNRRWYRCTDKAIQWVDGRMVRFEIAGDITELKLLEEELKSKNKELARSNEELEQFAYVASHDLQEPLRMVASYTQLLEERYTEQLDEKGKKFIKYANDGAVRMQTLIRDLLSFSRVHTQGKTIEFIESGEALEDALQNLKFVIRRSQAEITFPEMPAIHADKSQLSQLFQNLIGNGIKFRDSSVPVITISAEEKENKWVFSVSDNGIGIDPKYHNKIFNLFKRLHGRKEYEGTGVGLSICQRIMQRHNGKIWVDSVTGQGSTFYFSIPKL